jgi:hypothetical protein
MSEPKLPEPEEMDRLVSVAIRNAGRLSDRQAPRWYHVAQVFAIGSTRAASLCVSYGMDPDEERGGEYASETATLCDVLDE